MLKTIIKKQKNIYDEENELIQVENKTYIRKPNNEDELIETDVKVIETTKTVNNSDGTTNKIITCRNLVNGVPDDENIVYRIENVINENGVIIFSKKEEGSHTTLNEYDENGDLIRRHYSKKHKNKAFSTFNYNAKKQLISQTRFCKLISKDQLINRVYDYDFKGERTKMNMYIYEAENKNNFTLVNHIEKSFKYNSDGLYELETIKSNDGKKSVLIEIKNKKIDDLTFEQYIYNNGELQSIQIFEYIKIKDNRLLKSIVTNSSNGDFVRKVEQVYNDNGYVTEIVRTFIK